VATGARADQIASNPGNLPGRNRSHPFYQATWYHNALFNPNLPADARVLAFVRRTHDSAERRAALLEKLAGTFFQRPARFSDTLTALFLPGSELAGCLVSDRDCVLDFQRGVTRLSDRSGEKCPSRVRGPAR
jgi:hypothetical protein